MARKKRISILAMVSAAAVIAIMLPIQLAGTAGATHIDYGYTGPVMGQQILRLHTTNVSGEADSFFLDGSSTPVDMIGNGNGNAKCKMRLDGGATGATVAGDLVTLRAYGRNPSTGEQAVSTSWAVGFSNTDNSIGVASESSNNTKCAQVNEVSPTSEVLSLALNNDSGSLSGWYWDTLELDLEAKFRPPHVYYSLYWEGSPVSGQTKVDLPICTDPTADCGPDSTDSDNWRVAIPQSDGQGAYPSVLFDEVRIWPESNGNTVGNGSIDLKGGWDGTAPFCLSGDKPCTEWGLASSVAPGNEASVTDSLFRLVQPAEGEICEGGSVSEATGAGEATVTFRSDGDPNAVLCKAYSLVYTKDGDRQLEWLVGGSSATAIFQVEINAWDPEPAVNLVPLSKTDPAGSPGGDTDPAGEWCNGTGPLPLGGNPLDFFSMPDGEAWCAYSLEAHPAGTQMIQVTEGWLLVGDAKLNR